MSSFYKAFEDRFRGSRELITSRLKVYLPLIEPLKSIYPECKAIDLGCGRGEWLELLKNNGFQTHGIDLDAGMLEEANVHGLSTEQKDVIEYLRTLPDNSISIVTGFHIAEHLPFEVLKILIQESLRVLKPAGLLILETPNPENISVGSNTFYLDPTHVRPIPSNLLAFLVEYSGFSRVNTFRLNSALQINKDISLANVLNDASPDYSIVAQKHATLDLLDIFNEEFNRKHGFSAYELMMIYEQRKADNLIAIQQDASKNAESLLLHHEEQIEFLRHESGDKEIEHARFLKTSKEEFSQIHEDHKKNESKLIEQSIAMQQQTENLVRAQTQYEQKTAENISLIQQHAIKETAALKLRHEEQKELLQREIVELRKEHAQLVKADRVELAQIQKNHKTIELRFIEQVRVAQQQTENLLRKQVQREQDNAKQLLDLQQQAAREKHQLVSHHKNDIDKLSSQNAKQKQELQQQLGLVQTKLSNIELESAANVFVFDAKLLAQHHHIAKLEQQLAEQINDSNRKLASELKIAAQRECDLIEKTQADKFLTIQQFKEEIRILNDCEYALRMSHEKSEASLLKQLNSSEQQRINLIDHQDAMESAITLERISYIKDINQLSFIAAKQNSELTKKQSPIWNRYFSPLFSTQLTISNRSLFFKEDSIFSSKMSKEIKTNTLANRKIAYQPTFIVNPEGIYDLDDFQLLYDRQFICAAYLAILRREPDDTGLAYYLNRIRKGISKAKILAQFQKSPEALKHKTIIKGLRSAVVMEKLFDIPIIGSLILSVIFFLNVKNHLHDLRALENNIVRMAEETQLALHDNSNSG
jgi:SAM-dependent methyltransferase